MRRSTGVLAGAVLAITISSVISANPHGRTLRHHTGPTTDHMRRTAEPAIDLSRWGVFAALAGHDWMGSTGKPIMYLHYEWAILGAVLNISGQDASGKVIVGVITFDAASGKLTSQSMYGNKSIISSYEVQSDRVITSLGGGGRVQQSLIRLPQGYFQLVDQKQGRGGLWETTRVVVLTPTRHNLVASLGWPAPGARRSTFWKQLGQSFKGGAISGLHDGVQDGVHDAAQDRIRRMTGTQGQPTQTVRTTQSQ